MRRKRLAHAAFAERWIPLRRVRRGARVRDASRDGLESLLRQTIVAIVHGFADRNRSWENSSVEEATLPQTAEADQTSQTYLGQWHGLISTTNWEKGRIISEWREALRAAGAAAPLYSDDAWSRRVGQVSSQHVGRLRRVHERFGAVRQDYPGLYWSHFQAACEWSDAEMWLEGAVQNDWSISEMRAQRWQALGAPPAEQPRDADIVTSEMDEDFVPEDRSMSAVRQPGESDYDGKPDFGEGPDWGENGAAATTGPAQAGVPFDADASQYPVSETDPARPFENLPELPADLGEAFEAFKLAILRHKLAGWREISRDDLLSSLDALKQLART